MDTPAVLEQATRAHAEGNFYLAEQYSRSIVAQEPNHAGALQLIGLSARQQGDLSQAIDYLNRSLIADGTNAATWRHLGDAHLAVGSFRDAIANFEQALRLQPDCGKAYYSLGIAWQHGGEWEKSAECLRAAIALMPPSALAHNNLGIALKKQEKLGQAAAAFAEAVHLCPDHPEYVSNLAITLHENGDLNRAVPHYRESLRLNPGNAQASNNLGAILKEQGLVEEATSQFLNTLRIQPDHALSYYNLSEIAVEGRYQFPPGELDRIKALAASESCPASERSHFYFALAMMLNQQGSHDEAFRYYKQANDLRKHLNLQQNNVFDAQRHEAWVDRIIATHDLAYFEQVRGWGTDTELPVFIVGMPRTGSTLVEQILTSHPQVFGAGELIEIPHLIARLAARANGEMYSAPVVPNPRAAGDLAAEFLGCIPRVPEGAARVTVKNLDNYLHLGLIATLFPRARIIHCRRHPVDTCLACYFQNFHDLIFAWSLEDIGACYRAYEKLMAHWSRVLPLACLDLCYEELVHDQEGVTRKLLDFCGLNWDERCLRFYNTRRVVRTASSLQVRKPISAHTIGRWTHYRAHLEPLFRALGRWDVTHTMVPEPVYQSGHVRVSHQRTG